MKYANVFYVPHFNIIGGIETYCYELAKKYKDKDITFIYSDKTSDINQLNRIRKFPNGIIPKLTLPQVQIRIRKNSSYSNIKFSSNKNSKNLNECSNEKNKDSNKENEGDLFFSTAIKV